MEIETFNETYCVDSDIFQFQSVDELEQVQSFFGQQLHFFNEDEKRVFKISGQELKFDSFKFTILENLVVIYSSIGKISIALKSESDCSKLIKWFSEKKEEILDEASLLEELLEESFSINLKTNPKLNINSRQYLKKQIIKMINLYEKKDACYYGPYTTVCQSSGFGKSRACISLIDEGFYIVYCCLRDNQSSGYPNRSCLAHKFLDKSNVLNYFVCYFNAFIKLINNSEISCLDFFNKYNQELKDGHSNEIVNELIDSEIRCCSGNQEIVEYRRSIPLIFVFDEASSLLKIKSKKKDTTNFHILRQLLSKLKKNIFVLFLDTFSSLSKFMPTASQDVSARIAFGEMEVFEPIYLLPNWDVFVDEAKIEKMEDTVKFENICMFGRVLWGSWIDTKKNSNGKYKSIRTSQLYTLAWKKLIGVKTIDLIDVNDILAILSCRLGIIKPKAISSCQDMVARNMAVSVYVNNKKDIFEINYPSEPVLAEASAYLMNSIGHHRMVDILIDCLESSLISKGEKGETIAKLILLFAKDKSAKKDQVQDPLKFLDITRVGEFLQTLYGKCEEKCGSVENNWLCSGKKKHCCIKMINEQIKNASALLNGLINFNHFVRSKNSMSNTLLVPALKRCAAYQCKQNEKSIDFIIPVCINRDNLDLVTALMVQVKLYHNPSKPKHKSYVEYAFKEMSKDFTGQKGFMVLYMQLGEPLNEQPFICSMIPKEDSHFNQYQAIIYSQGISQNIFPLLSSGLDAKLVYFSQANEKINKSNEDSDNNEIYDTICYL